jgi:hypothetical protein
MKQGAAANFAFIEPMKALRVQDLPGGDWLYEMKFDGYRALAFKAGKEVRLVSRNRTSFNNDYPQLIDALKSLTATQATIDGEITALDDEGKSSFQLLQSFGKAKQIPIVYYAFDLLLLNRSDLRSRPLIERRKLLARLLNKESSTKYTVLRGATWLKRRASPGSAAILPRGPDRQKTGFSLRGRSTQGRLGQSETDESAGVCHRRLHPARRQPQILRLFACWLPGSGRSLVRRQSRHWLLGKAPGGPPWCIAQNRARDLPFC